MYKYRQEADPLQRGLPKWPQMLVRGEPMEIEQAKEIIRRTDHFFLHGGGNDHDYCKRVAKMLRFPLFDHSSKDRDLTVFDRQDEWRAKWGWFGGEYVHNTWISSSYIGGPYGWCNPDGQIKYDANIGKHPSCEAVLEEWTAVAKEFPWVDCSVILMDREQTEEGIEPVCGFRVAGGLVRVFDPLEQGPSYQAPEPESEEDFYQKSPCFDISREHGIPWEWIEEWAEMAKEIFK